ncbi:HepT-like ribonuclease domain-containing protein [Roseofilum casamattae]|uniref:DUF86 domain-containing protein n=1 Tax=Roseofilum casamattae BLCC-M143 TaxID=3022442 RepID=A0ABT7BV10_9CYAN|nr:DUF86 domain-containing protein [Roseofilum casamattae]MDJ1183025.1 DUF86 domain-containing protein [Roseofilum casamattae BLCC-M143]
MSSRESLERIQDILAAVSRIQKRTIDLTFAEFEADDTIVSACLYDFIIIGEAAINVPLEIRSRYSHIPWRLMGDMRNVIVHEYFQINLDIIWHTIQDYLPPLILPLQGIIDRENLTDK